MAAAPCSMSLRGLPSSRRRRCSRSGQAALSARSGSTSAGLGLGCFLRLEPDEDCFAAVADVAAELDARERAVACVLAHPGLGDSEEFGDLRGVQEAFAHPSGPSRVW